MVAWAEECGISYKALQYRLATGMAVEEALTRPVRDNGQKGKKRKTETVER
jgi:hypothetical protein